MNWADSKYPRNKGWQGRTEFDKLLSEISISGLEYLELTYKQRLDNYRDTHDLTNDECLKEYIELERRLNMISQEEFRRTMDNMAIQSRDVDIYGRHDLDFDSEKGIIYTGEYGTKPMYVEFDENETTIITRADNGGVTYFLGDNEVSNNSPKLSRRDIYKDWDYWNAGYSEE